MEYELIYANRKTIGVQINDDLSLTVRAPHGATKAQIEKALSQLAPRIAKGIARQEAALAQKESFSIDAVESLPLLGKEIPLIREARRDICYDGSAFRVPRDCHGDVLQNALVKVYRKLAAQYIKPRAMQLGDKLSLIPTAIRINGAKTRWGSCSGQNSLNFSWGLIMAPPDAVDSVIIHELCHMKHHDHSKAFWALVHTCMPDYDRHKPTLKALGEKLRVEGWLDKD